MTEQLKMPIEHFNKLAELTFDEIRKLWKLKGGEYSGDDNRLENFVRNATALGVEPELIWAVYAGKHWDAIQQYCKDVSSGKERERLEAIEGRFDDLIAYVMLGKAMVLARRGYAGQIMTDFTKPTGPVTKK
jgi:hypothetical protein